MVARWLTVRAFKQQLLALAAGRWDRIDIVAHSFGTYLAAKALYSLRKGAGPRIHTLILAGSVLPSLFDWPTLVPRHVGRVINECGIRDGVLWMSQAVPLLGMAGRAGFYGMTGTTLRNRFFDVGHSGYFQHGGTSSDTFMRDQWLPLLLGNLEAGHDQRPTGRYVGLEGFLVNNVRPLKSNDLTVLTALFLVGYVVPRVGAAYAINLVSQEQGYVANENDRLKSAGPRRRLAE